MTKLGKDKAETIAEVAVLRELGAFVTIGRVEAARRGL
jgi:hypothetical protein